MNLESALMIFIGAVFILASLFTTRTIYLDFLSTLALLSPLLIILFVFYLFFVDQNG